MSLTSRFVGGILTFIERSTQERVLPLAPVLFYDDFLGGALQTTEVWTAIDVSAGGNTTPLIGADLGNGLIRLPLDATVEVQESGITWGDQRPLVLNQGLQIEMRLCLRTLPTLTAEAVWGLAGDKNASADAVAESIWFKADGNGVIVVECDDTAAGHTLDDQATGVTVVAAAFHIFRIDCSDISNVKFYIDGVRVAESVTFNMNTVPALKLQPYVHIAKGADAGVGTVDVDYIRCWQKRS